MGQNERLRTSQSVTLPGGYNLPHVARLATPLMVDAFGYRKRQPRSKHAAVGDSGAFVGTYSARWCKYRHSNHTIIIDKDEGRFRNWAPGRPGLFGSSKFGMVFSENWTMRFDGCPILESELQSYYCKSFSATTLLPPQKHSIRV